jgi:hypothetical protein
VVRNRGTELYTACLEAAAESLSRLAEAYSSGDVYAFVFLVASGYEGLGFAYGTRSELQEKATDEPIDVSQLLKAYPHLLEIANAHKTSESYAEVNAVEWRNDLDFSSNLRKTNKLIKQIIADESYGNAAELIEAVLLEVALALRQSEAIKQPAFSNDMLLGVQFPDPLPREVANALRISKHC